MAPLRIDIIAYAPTRFYHCLHCEVVFHQVGHGQKIHAEQDRSALPEDLRREYEALSDWVRHLFDRWGDDVLVKVIDAASVEGVLKSLRHRVRRYPSVIVGGKRRVQGGDFALAESLIEHELTATSTVLPGRE